MTTSQASPGDVARPTMTARTPEDVLAAVPVVLGFTPHDSIVMLTFGTPEAFHARIDLPRTDEEVAETVDALVAPAARHGVRRVLLVVYAAAGDRAVARRAATALVLGLDEADVEVLDVLVADGERWSRLVGASPPGMPADGLPYDVADHRFTAQAVFDGRVLHTSRAELAAALAADPVAQDAVAGCAGSVPPADRERVVALLAGHLAAGVLPDHGLAEVLLGIRDPRVRDAAWGAVTRATARDHVRLWSDAVRRAPEELGGGAAAVLAFAAWAAGHGALAWCAVDRCRAVDDGNTLAELVADLLQQAVPPAWWDQARADVAGTC